MLLLALMLVQAGQAWAVAQDPILLIQAKEDKAIADFDAEVILYQQYLDGSPPLAGAATERDKALADIATKAEKVRGEIWAEMSKYPDDPAVQEAGWEAMAVVTDGEATFSVVVRDAYDAYAAGGPTTTTTTTLPASSSPPPSTTSTTTASDSSPTNPSPSPGGGAGPPMSTTTAAGQTDPSIPASPGGAEPPRGVDQGRSDFLVSLLASLPATVSERSSAASVHSNGDPSRLAGLVELVRLRLPRVLADPVVDFMIIIRAVIAALTSGIATMKWPMGALSVGFLLQQGLRRLRR